MAMSLVEILIELRAQRRETCGRYDGQYLLISNISKGPEVDPTNEDVHEYEAARLMRERIGAQLELHGFAGRAFPALNVPRCACCIG
jgi:hypothetical protein